MAERYERQLNAQFDAVRAKALEHTSQSQYEKALATWNDALQLCGERIGPKIQILYRMAELYGLLGSNIDALNRLKTILKLKQDNEYIIQKDLFVRMQTLQIAIDRGI